MELILDGSIWNQGPWGTRGRTLGVQEVALLASPTESGNIHPVDIMQNDVDQLHLVTATGEGISKSPSPCNVILSFV